MEFRFSYAVHLVMHAVVRFRRVRRQLAHGMDDDRGRNQILRRVYDVIDKTHGYLAQVREKKRRGIDLS